jgi:hypothetical protein
MLRGWRLETRLSSMLLLSASELFFITNLHVPRRKHSLYCWEEVFTAPLHSNEIYSIFACVFVAAGICLPSCCLETGCITPLFCCSTCVLLSNGCFSGSTVFAWSKYATIRYYRTGTSDGFLWTYQWTLRCLMWRKISWPIEHCYFLDNDQIYVSEFRESTWNILSHVRGSVSNNNGFWIGWLDLLTPYLYSLS